MRFVEERPDEASAVDLLDVTGDVDFDSIGHGVISFDAEASAQSWLPNTPMHEILALLTPVGVEAAPGDASGR